MLGNGLIKPISSFHGISDISHFCAFILAFAETGKTSKLNVLTRCVEIRIKKRVFYFVRQNRYKTHRFVCCCNNVYNSPSDYVFYR